MNIRNYEYNPTVEMLVQILMDKTRNFNPHFFRLQTNYMLATLPSNMQVYVETPITGRIPINFYGLNLALSGSGKGVSTNFLQNYVLRGFQQQFLEDVVPKHVAITLDGEAMNRAAIWGINHQDALERLNKEYKSYGAMLWKFDSATLAAIKQYRNKLVLGKIGAITMQMDEMGANMKNNAEVLSGGFLELYDMGYMSPRLLKASAENERFQETFGSVPTNMLLFGTPSRVLDGGANEDLFYSLMLDGMGRRCFIGYAEKSYSDTEITAKELLESIVNQKADEKVQDLSNRLRMLAHLNLVGKTIRMGEPECEFLLEYRLHCEAEARKLPDHAEIQRAEMENRFFKVIKLAGVYAFIDGKLDITKEHLKQAMRFAEDSGVALTNLMKRPKHYERLAKYIAQSDTPLTEVDLVEELPFYKGTIAQKNELMSLAVAWGVSNGYTIKANRVNGVTFYSGSALEKTNLNEMRVAYSVDVATDYLNEVKPFDFFKTLVIQQGYHWINHHVVGGKRDDDHIETGFNVLVFDVDGGIKLQTAMEMLKDYKFIVYTTKRHNVPNPETGEVKERFRIIIPMSHTLHLQTKDYRQFMENVAKWLPFEVDTHGFHRSAKWACNPNAELYENTEGELLDVFPFIPNTQPEATFRARYEKLSDLSAIQRWFVGIIENGNRNNAMLKYALMLVDSGMTYDQIIAEVDFLNRSLDEPLSEKELNSTIFVTVKKKVENHD